MLLEAVKMELEALERERPARLSGVAYRGYQTPRDITNLWISRLGRARASTDRETIANNCPPTIDGIAQQDGACTTRTQEVPRQASVRPTERQPQGPWRPPWIRCLSQHCARRRRRREGQWGESKAWHGGHPRKLSCHAGGPREDWRR